MTWQVCLKYANGREIVLKTYHHREKALKCIDFIYSTYGYPMHIAFIVRPGNPATRLHHTSIAIAS
ncbi:hypothetical protein [Roseofilum casamattae]|uniref:Family 2 glycosyl transferase n=1 Tax=Roseofilum casamattae BLCC-M143 TaxID=3022442 RepID=A0ABT7BRC2_9CYAN|nr:hypothetical protein [Roseofilum casamattae]MDJ1181740.1 family 2 glycosyl transferase [Roseofilum casamattae BLCC-M143]